MARACEASKMAICWPLKESNALLLLLLSFMYSILLICNEIKRGIRMTSVHRHRHMCEEFSSEMYTLSKSQAVCVKGSYVSVIARTSITKQDDQGPGETGRERE